MSDKEWVPAFDGQRPPLNGRDPLHGAYSEKSIGPLADAIEEHLRGLSPEYGAADDHARRVLANQIARQELVRRWLNEHGLIDERGRTWPVVEQLAKWERASLEFMRDLGMTTRSRVELDLDRLQFAKDTVSFAEMQEAIGVAFKVAAKYVPRERLQAYLAEVRSAVNDLDAGSATVPEDARPELER